MYSTERGGEGQLDPHKRTIRVEIHPIKGGNGEHRYSLPS
jgi:hypothetical protein